MEAIPTMILQKETTRSVKSLGVTNKVMKREPSKEAIRGLGMRSKREIIGHMAINPPEIEFSIRMLKANILREMALMTPDERQVFTETPIDFVKDKGNRKRYEIKCVRCGDVVAYVWAENEKLENWCDLHYICWYNKSSWRGGRAINVAPIDGQIGIECCCGEDTRDFRAGKGMPPIQKSLMIDYTHRHRDFGLPTSTFIAVEI